MITIENHRAHLNGVPVEWRPSPNVGGLMEPQLIVLHETASRLDGSSVAWLCTARSKVSAHFVIRRDGSIVQLVDCNRVAWHAGQSEWCCRANCNGYGIGIELEGPGLLHRRGNSAVAWFGQSWPLHQCIEVDSAAHGGKGWWLPFTSEQIESNEALVLALGNAYGRITDVAGHYEISPGRKVDPSPLYPIDRCKAMFIAREAPDYGLVKATQEKLIELGYDAGDADGTMGPRTRGALRTFQDVNGLPVTGELDTVTADRLASDSAQHMTTGTREATTKADVQSTETFVTKRTSEGTAGTTVMNAVDKSADTIGKFAKAKTTSEQGSVLLEWAMSPLGFRTLGILAVCGIVWWAANRVDWKAVRARAAGFATRGA